MLSASTQSASCCCMVPVGPYLWNVHLVTRGNTSIMGSVRFSWFMLVNSSTLKPYVMNVPPKNESIIIMLRNCKTEDVFEISLSLGTGTS